MLKGNSKFTHVVMLHRNSTSIYKLTGSIGSNASCLAFLAGLAEGGFIPPSALPSLLAGALEGTAGADSTTMDAAGTAHMKPGDTCCTDAVEHCKYHDKCHLANCQGGPVAESICSCQDTLACLFANYQPADEHLIKQSGLSACRPRPHRSVMHRPCTA